DRAQLSERQVRGAARIGSAGHARLRAAAHRRYRLPDGSARSLGRLLRHDGRPGRRLHVLVHDRVHPDYGPGAVAHANRLVPVPAVRPAAEPATATATSATATAPAAASATARLLRDELLGWDDSPGLDRS